MFFSVSSRCARVLRFRNSEERGMNVLDIYDIDIAGVSLV